MEDKIPFPPKPLAFVGKWKGFDWLWIIYGDRFNPIREATKKESKNLPRIPERK